MVDGLKYQRKQLCIELKVREGLELEYRKGISYFGMNQKENEQVEIQKCLNKKGESRGKIGQMISISISVKVEANHLLKDADNSGSKQGLKKKCYLENV